MDPNSQHLDYSLLILHQVRDAGSLRLVVASSILFLIYRVGATIFDVFFGPLSKFPGPKLWAATYLPLVWTLSKGKEGAAKSELHAKYGPCVRISPTDLSYCDGQAWKSIYGHKSAAGTGNVPKDYAFYSGAFPQDAPPSVLYGDDATHSRHRKVLAHSFSDKALKEQEPLLLRWGNTLVAKLDERAQDPTKSADLLAYYNFATFDIMGELTFSEPLGMLEEAKYNAWVETMFGSFQNAVIMSALKRLPGMAAVIDLLLGPFIRKMQIENFNYSKVRVEKRLSADPSSPDLWTQVLERAGKDGEPSMSLDEMFTTAATFMIAGTETTSTLLSGLSYHLMRNPEAMAKLTSEIRSAFPDASSITLDPLRRLPYLNACIEEGLRMYPPVPSGLPRLTPKGGSVICGEFVPENTTVSVSHWSANHSSANFRSPNTFIPERWLPSASDNESSPFAKDDHSAFQPFSTGPRNCIGKNLAYHEMRVLLSLVLWHFDLELDDKCTNWVDQGIYTLWEKRPLWVKVARVER